MTVLPGVARCPRRRVARLAPPMLAACVMGCWSPPTSDSGDGLQRAIAWATTPTVKTGGPWQKRHELLLNTRDQWLERGVSPRLVFIGDSITENWRRDGRDVWEERFAPRGAMNLGISADRTEQVLWRLGAGIAGEFNNEAAGLRPDVFVVMIGTNNTGQIDAPPQATAAGVAAVVDRLRQVSPESTVLLLAIFPRGADPSDRHRRINAEVNRRIASLGQHEGVEFLDINAALLDRNGELSREVMPDLLHPSAAGYRRWADAIEPTIARLLGEVAPADGSD